MSINVPAPVVSAAADALNPLNFIGNSFGLPSFLTAILYPQAMELAKRYPRLWKVLSGLVAIQLTYSYTRARLIKILAYFISICARSVKVYEGDELLGCFFRWLDKQKPSITHEEMVTAQSLQYKNTARAIESSDDLTNTPEGLEPNNFAIQRRYRVRMFRHNGRLFWLSRTAAISTAVTSRDGQPVKKKGITIWTLGRSIKPITAILEEAVESHSNDGEKSATTLYIPSNTSGGDWYHDGSTPSIWRKHAVKPCRALDTVYLAGGQRESIQQDVARFLHPDTATRYRSKGIPHRRGYMFYGPPGNGKSSLAMALAGHFGLNVYSLSLRDPHMNDSFLGQLFNVLPSSKVLVLLEDIDSAGLKREEEFEDSESEIADEDAIYEETGFGQPATYRRRRRPPPRVTNVTLSGVLNALDGISAPEGHIVVMTTNAPDSLDKALVRPGRVDLKVEFKNASPKQLYDIFSRMYRDEKATATASASSNTTTTTADPAASTSASNTPSSIASPIPTPVAIVTDNTPDEKLPPIALPLSCPYNTLLNHLPKHLPPSPSTLHHLATQFSHLIPANHHSLASVQNFLLGRVDDPVRAVAEAASWAAEEQREKEEAERRKMERATKREARRERRRGEVEVIRKMRKGEGNAGVLAWVEEGKGVGAVNGVGSGGSEGDKGVEKVAVNGDAGEEKGEEKVVDGMCGVDEVAVEELMQA